MADPIIPINPNSDLSQIVSMMNQNFAQLGASSVTSLYKDSTGTPNIIVGLQSDGSSGIKVALPGINVTAATAAQLAFDSGKSFTVNLSDTYTFPSLGSVGNGSVVFGTTQVIPHGSKFRPGVNVYAPISVGSPDLSAFLPPGLPEGASTLIANASLVYQLGLAYSSIYYGVDETNFYLGQAFTNDSGGSVTSLPVPVTYYVYTYNAATT